MANALTSLDHKHPPKHGGPSEPTTITINIANEMV